MKTLVSVNINFHRVTILSFFVLFRVLLIISLVFQFLTADVLSDSEVHQIDIKHLQTQHDHNSDTHTAESNMNDGHDINDCHHCGHCSGSHISWVLANSINNYTKPQANNATPYHIDETKEFLDAILRPPIA